jgi:hypothetical protein
MISGLMNQFARDTLKVFSNSDSTEVKLTPTVSYYALIRSIENVQSAVLFYCQLYDISSEAISRYTPLLIFVEATIYQIDEENEANVYDSEFLSAHVHTLKSVLMELYLLDESLAMEIQNGLTYYNLERHFCSGGTITRKDIDTASLFKCFDFGILQRLILKIFEQPYDESFLGVCRLSDQILKIHCDLEDYDKDVKRNVINAYRMFCRLYGDAAPQEIHAYLQTLNRELEVKLAELRELDSSTAKKFNDLWMLELEKYPCPEIPYAILEKF